MTFPLISQVVDESYLVDAAAYINARWSIIDALWHEVGVKLCEVKDAVGHGVFVQWVDDHFAFSLSTADKMMQAARNVPQLAHHTVDRAALYLLAQNNTSPHARELIEAVASEGQPIDYHKAYVASRAPVAIIERWRGDDLTAKQAFALTKAIEKRPEPVQALALQTRVTEPPVVEYLARAYDKWQNTPNKEDTAWREIVAHKGLLIDGELVPLDKATGRDVDAYNSERQLRHIQANAKPILLDKVVMVVGDDGVLCIGDLPPGARVKVSVWHG